MKKLFVPYEIALLAKEQGFNEPCLALYDSFDNELHTWRVSDTLVKPTDVPDSIVAPLYQQLLAWIENRGYLIRKSDNGVFYEVIDLEMGLYMEMAGGAVLDEVLSRVLLYKPKELNDNAIDNCSDTN
jgi:hypothetical protein